MEKFYFAAQVWLKVKMALYTIGFSRVFFNKIYWDEKNGVARFPATQQVHFRVEKTYHNIKNIRDVRVNAIQGRLRSLVAVPWSQTSDTFNTTLHFSSSPTDELLTYGSGITLVITRKGLTLQVLHCTGIDVIPFPKCRRYPSRQRAGPSPPPGLGNGRCNGGWIRPRGWTRSLPQR